MGIVWIAIDGHSSSGSCPAGVPASCVPVYNTKTAGYVLTGMCAAATAGGVLFYTGRPHGSEVTVAAGPSSLFVAGRF